MSAHAYAGLGYVAVVVLVEVPASPPFDVTENVPSPEPAVRVPDVSEGADTDWKSFAGSDGSLSALADVVVLPTTSRSESSSWSSSPELMTLDRTLEICSIDRLLESEVVHRVEWSRLSPPTDPVTTMLPWLWIAFAYRNGWHGAENG